MDGSPNTAATREIHGVLRRIVLGAALLMPLPALAQDSEVPGRLRVYAAGSLTAAFNALLDAFGTPPGVAVTAASALGRPHGS